jgi:SnoaL-like domain
MQYLSLMIGSSDMPLDGSSAESGRTADAPGALPRPPTSSVGRQHELADARRLLAHNRLLTLTGPGGCGKTRLAIELAAGVADEYPDGVHFVSLAGITDPALVPRSIAQGVGLQDSRGRPLLEHLSGYVTEPVTATFRFVASTFSDVVTFDWETLASGVAGDFAYTAAVERYTNSRDGGPPEQTELRATHVYRRESGHWRAVHRHADRRPPGS